MPMSYVYVDRTYADDFTLYQCFSRCGCRSPAFGLLTKHVLVISLPKDSKETTVRNKSSPPKPRAPRAEKPAKVAKAKAAKAKAQPVPSKSKKAALR